MAWTFSVRIDGLFPFWKILCKYCCALDKCEMHPFWGESYQRDVITVFLKKVEQIKTLPEKTVCDDKAVEVSLL